MKVVAQADAFRNGRRIRKGAVLEVGEGEKARWWKPVDEAEPLPAPTQRRGRKPKEPETLAEMSDQPAESFTSAMAGDD